MLPVSSFSNNLPISAVLPTGLDAEVQAVEKAIADCNWQQVRLRSEVLLDSGRAQTIKETQKKGNFDPLGVALKLFSTFSKLQWDPDTRDNLARFARLFIELACMQSVYEKKDLLNAKEIAETIDRLLPITEDDVKYHHELLCSSVALQLLAKLEGQEYFLALFEELAGIKTCSQSEWLSKIGNDAYLKESYHFWTNTVNSDFSMSQTSPTPVAEPSTKRQKVSLGVDDYKRALMYFDNTSDLYDPKTAVKYFIEAAKSGHPDAQFLLGYCYDRGEGVARDLVEAAKWFTEGAKNGNVSAQFNLGDSYCRGEGVPRDPVEAVKWYVKAASGGDAERQYELGMRYLAGIGSDRQADRIEARKWFTQAAQQGYAAAQSMLEMMKK